MPYASDLFLKYCPTHSTLDPHSDENNKFCDRGEIYTVAEMFELLIYLNNKLIELVEKFIVLVENRNISND